MKTALVYDRVNKWGGAERVLLALHDIFPDADLFTSVYNPRSAKWAEVFNIKTSFLQKIPFANRVHELLGTFMPLAFESFDFEKYDLVISVTSEAAKGIITKPKTLHICYCLTPTRYLWSGFDVYFKNPLFRFISAPLVSYLKMWDKVAAYRPDEFIAISTEVKSRIKKYYNRDSAVIFPPLFLQELEPVLPQDKDYFLIISRFVPYKRIDLAIKTFNKLNLPLKIIGSGWDESDLKGQSSENIEFLNNLSEAELYGYYKNCKALIHPSIEDFGLAMVEAQYFGKPVIAYRGGGALDIIKEGETGEFFDEQKTLTSVLEKFESKRYNESVCRENALRFSFANFKNNLLEFIQDFKL